MNNRGLLFKHESKNIIGHKKNGNESWYVSKLGVEGIQGLHDKTLKPAIRCSFHGRNPGFVSLVSLESLLCYPV